jgi:hypothetical protein
MPEPFSHEDRMAAGEQVLNVLDAIEDKDLQQHLLAIREAADHAATNLKDQGFGDKAVSQVLIGIVLSSAIRDDQ